jgi:GTP-binding protein
LEKIEVNPLDEEEYESFILYKYKREDPFTVEKDGDVFVLKGAQIERLFRMTKFSSEEGILRFAKKLTRMGVEQRLDELGAVQGDSVRILDYVFEYRS